MDQKGEGGCRSSGQPASRPIGTVSSEERVNKHHWWTTISSLELCTNTLLIHTKSRNPEKKNKNKSGLSSGVLCGAGGAPGEAVLDFLF